jgi:hypothetical protein
MTQEHPITPPPELVEQWLNAPRYAKPPKDGTFVVQKCHSQWLPALSESEVIALVEKAARWGADQELEACSELFKKFYSMETWMERDLRELLSARRPKPPSLKAQALVELELLRGDANTHGLGFNAHAIRRALEALPE